MRPFAYEAFLFFPAILLCGAIAAAAGEPADDPDAPAGRPGVKRVILVGQGPDNHAWSTHEYMAGMRILADCLQPVEGLQTILVQADGQWSDGPELLDGADAAVLFVSQGAKWLQDDERRLAAFNRLAERGGGLIALHWAMGCKDAEYVDAFVKIFGGCHGGPDRKYKIAQLPLELAAPEHPILRGIEPVEAEDEFYYALKFVKPAEKLTPLVRVPIDDQPQTIAWAWERPDGGRSFGFSGLHFHGNWELVAYRRMATQAVLWTLKRPIPNELPLAYDKEDLTHPRPKPE